MKVIAPFEALQDLEPTVLMSCNLENLTIDNFCKHKLLAVYDVVESNLTVDLSHSLIISQSSSLRSKDGVLKVY